jgi:hypothetical protein
MAISTLANLRTALDAQQRVSFFKRAAPLVNSRFANIYDQFRATGLPTNGSTAIVGNAGVTLDKASQGAVLFNSAGSGNQLYLAGVSSQACWDTRTAEQFVFANGMIHVWDRLWYNDSIISNSTARRAWTPPALTRYASGEGLSIWYIQIGSGTGSGTVTYTLEYTNQAGAATSVQYTWNHGGDSIIANVAQAVAVPLALGDSGVQAVTAVTQSAAIVSGSYGFAIQKYLGAFPISLVSSYPVQDNNIFCGMPQIDNDAFLCFGLQMGPPTRSGAFSAGAAPTVNGELVLIEG